MGWPLLHVLQALAADFPPPRALGWLAAGCRENRAGKKGRRQLAHWPPAIGAGPAGEGCEDQDGDEPLRAATRTASVACLQTGPSRAPSKLPAYEPRTLKARSAYGGSVARRAEHSGAAHPLAASVALPASCCCCCCWWETTRPATLLIVDAGVGVGASLGQAWPKPGPSSEAGWEPKPLRRQASDARRGEADPPPHASGSPRLRPPVRAFHPLPSPASRA